MSTLVDMRTVVAGQIEFLRDQQYKEVCKFVMDKLWKQNLGSRQICDEILFTTVLWKFGPLKSIIMEASLPNVWEEVNCSLIRPIVFVEQFMLPFCILAY